jgi:hypothetical protein
MDTNARSLMQSAREWRRDRMIERTVARFVANGAAVAAAEPIQPAPAEPIRMPVAGGPMDLLNTRRIVPVPEARLDLQNGGPWQV